MHLEDKMKDCCEYEEAHKVTNRFAIFQGAFFLCLHSPFQLCFVYKDLYYFFFVLGNCLPFVDNLLNRVMLEYRMEVLW